MPTYYSNIAADTKLNGAITNVATSLTVVSSTGYPSTPFNIEIGSEVIRVGSKAGLVFSSLTRGYDASRRGLSGQPRGLHARRPNLRLQSGKVSRMY